MISEFGFAENVTSEKETSRESQTHDGHDEDGLSLGELTPAPLMLAAGIDHDDDEPETDETDILESDGEKPNERSTSFFELEHDGPKDERWNAKKEEDHEANGEAAPLGLSQG